MTFISCAHMRRVLFGFMFLARPGFSAPHAEATSHVLGFREQRKQIITTNVSLYHVVMSADDGNTDTMPLAGSSQSARPPPERSSIITIRRLILLAFWVVIVAFGLPHWIWTTSIHRAALPLDSMRSWDDGQVSSIILSCGNYAHALF